MIGWFLKMARKPPAFQCYASNLIADKNYRLMSLRERGLWVSMYLECWVNEEIPLSQDMLAKFLGFEVDEINLAMTKTLMSFFSSKDDVIVCPELDDYRLTLKSIRKKQSDGGRVAQEKRRKGGRKENESLLAGVLESPDASSLDKVKLNQSNLDESIDEWISDYENGESINEYQKCSKGF